MQQGVVVGLIVSALVVSGAVMLVRPPVLFLADGSSGSEVPFRCENRVEGDRVEIRDESAGQRVEIRIESGSLVRAEARFEMGDSSSRRETRIEICGFVHFVDRNSNGRLDSMDEIVRSAPVEFGSIDHVRMDGAHLFNTSTSSRDFEVNLSLPVSFPATDVPLVHWMATAHPTCEANVTHFAVLVEQDEPTQFRRSFAGACGTTLVASEKTVPAAPPAGPPECRQMVSGRVFEVSLAEQDGGSMRLEGRVEASTRVRADVRLETGDWEARVRRESRLELCGFLQFVDRDGDGAFGPADTVVSTRLVAFENLTHAIEGTMHVFEASAMRGNLTVTIRIPATFPTSGEPLIRWTVAADPSCEAGATHYAVRLQQEAPMGASDFLVAKCGVALNTTGEA